MGVLAGLLVLVLSACERPFVEVSTPGIEIVEPDFSTVFVDARIAISVSASSFRPIQEVRLNNVRMAFDANRNLWDAEADLRRGLNTFVVEAFDVDGVVGVDTAYAVHLPFLFTLSAPRLPVGRGGHTATVLRNGNLIVIGGAETAGGPAQDDAFLLLASGATFEVLNADLNVARTGHTATVLPDGRVLILGGSRTDNLVSVEDLVETVEVFNPVTSTFDSLAFDGQPIRRALHTAVLRNTSGGVFIDLYGGRGDIRYGTDPRLGTRRDLRTFELVGDTLFALNTLNSAPFLEAAISGHTETRIQGGIYLVFGTFFDAQFMDEASFRIDYNAPVGLLVTDAPPMLTPRTRHAAGTLGNRLMILFGGRQALPTDILTQTEIYSDDASRFFRLPNSQQTVKRFGHTATNLSSQRILLVGGFAADGNSLTASEFFVVTPAN